VRLVRVARGVGLSELAASVGISTSYLSLIEGDRRHPSLRVLRLLAEHLRVPPGVLLWEASDAEGAGSRDQPEPLHGLLAALYEILKETDSVEA